MSPKHRVVLTAVLRSCARGLAGLVGAAGVAAAVACGMDDGSPFGGPDSLDAGRADAGRVPPLDDGGAAIATGVVLLHAAAFPAFRLCFENYPELAPQPDRKVMPQANVVGVEVGSVVRIGPLERPPGEVYVIVQRHVLAGPHEGAVKSCGELFEDGSLTRDIHYHVAGRLEQPLGVDRVDLLAITGCGNGGWINSLGVPKEDCGPGWNETSGSLRSRTLTLPPVGVATAQTLPVQVVHMAPLLDTKRDAGEEVEVTFGRLDADAGPLAQEVAIAPPLFDTSAPVTLDVDQTTEATYGTYGFRIAVRTADAGHGFALDQTLAEIQELSAPEAVATTYYLTSSSYALLLLGDPRVTRTYADGGRNPEYARRSVHLLAVPIREASEAPSPSPAEAGSPDGEAPEGGL